MDIKDLVEGERIEETFAVLSVEERRTRDGKPFLSVNLSHTSGKIGAKVFSEAIPHSPLKQSKIFSIQGKFQNYRGSPSLLIDSASEVEGESIDQYLPQVPTMVFDIETVGKPFSELEKSDQDYLLNTLEKNLEPKEAKQRTALHSLYGFITYIGMLNSDTGKGKVIGTSDKKYTPENKNFSYKNCKDEKDLLEKFWQIASQYEQFVTFNGKRFDVPFLVFRSLVNGVTIPTNVNNSGKHIDLLTCLCPYGSKLYKLEAISKALGVINPKEKGISGLHVSKLYYEKKYQEIIDYVSRDVISTAELYKLWRKLAPALI